MIVSRHAVARYRQRVAPTLSRREALNELRELLAHAECRADPPLWAATWRARDAQVGQEVTPAVKAPREKPLVAVNWADSYLVVDDELCFPVIASRVMTVITKTVRVSPPGPGSRGRSLAELEAESRTAQQQQLHSKAQRQLAKSLARSRQRQVDAECTRSLGRQTYLHMASMTALLVTSEDDRLGLGPTSSPSQKRTPTLAFLPSAGAAARPLQ